MAIKGKRKTKHRSSRTAPRAPRPYYVAPRTPLFQRTGTKVVLVLLAEALVFLLLVLAGAETKADRRREQISEFTTLVQAQLYGSGVAQQSFTGPLILPELGQAVAQLQSGQLEDANGLVESATGWARSAADAADNVARIQATGLELTEARNLMEQGLRLYSELADEIRVAAELDGSLQADLAETIGEQMDLSATIFDTGWGKLQEERRRAGLETEAVLPGDLGGLPGGVPGLTGPGDVPTVP